MNFWAVTKYFYFVAAFFVFYFYVNVNMIKYQKVTLPVTEEDVRISGVIDKKYDAQITSIEGDLVFFVNTSLIAATDVSIDTFKPYIIVTNPNKLGTYATELKTESIDGITVASTVTINYEIVEQDGA